MTSEQFLAEWLGRNAQLARAVPGVGGIVFSEASRGSGPGPVMDAMVEYWTTDGDDVPQSAALDAWLAHTASLIEQSQSRWIVSREHVALQPPAAG
jgi:hypothetical protein